ncbi:MAG: tetratricopeptide repeat protein [Candidatus Gastranaerophilales bacterium]|nr:tetratricopeptide repeat protein [Candidatus Gastranaerophilales bacterium]
MKKNLIISLFILMSLTAFNPTFADTKEDATIFYNEAIDLYRQDDVDKSIELFSKAIELNPDFYEAHYNLAQILMSVNKNEEALKSLEKITKLRPNDSEALYNIAKIQYKQGFLSNSYETLKKIKEEAPQYESAKLLISKIEKRQNELNLEEKLKENKTILDLTGKAKAINLEEIQAPSGIAVDIRGNIYVASFSENKVYKISIYGQKTVYSESSLIKGPIGLAIDKNDNLYIANYSANNIIKISSTGSSSVFAEIQKPYCLIYDAGHNRLYATEQNTNKLVKFDL